MNSAVICFQKKERQFMNKFLFEFAAVLVVWCVVSILVSLFAPDDWFWPTFELAAVAVILYIVYRFHRLWLKRCRSCGSLRISIEKRKLWPENVPPFGSRFDCENLIVCHNARCPDYLRGQRYSCYIKSFGLIEVLWRKLWGEKFPQ